MTGGEGGGWHEAALTFIAPFCAFTFASLSLRVSGGGGGGRCWGVELLRVAAA